MVALLHRIASGPGTRCKFSGGATRISRMRCTTAGWEAIELPQSICCDLRSFDHRSQLCPGDVGINCQQACEGCKPAVGSGDDLFAPNNGSIAFQALGDQFRVLDKIGGGIEHAWNDDLALRQPDLLKDLPLMLMARIGPFKGDC